MHAVRPYMHVYMHDNTYLYIYTRRLSDPHHIIMFLIDVTFFSISISISIPDQNRRLEAYLRIRHQSL